jgi:dephospho-CoA kinase
VDVARDRIMKRNNLTVEQADQRINAQMTYKERVKYADVVIYTDCSLELLERYVADVFEHFKQRTASLVN